MKKFMKILMVFPEVAPFSRTCSMADVGNGLPKALKDKGHDVRLITPQYRVINERKYVLRDVIRLQDIRFPMGDQDISIDVKSSFLPGSKVQVYFIDYKPFFFRDGLYAESKTGKLYPDNDRRFMLFSRGVLETLIRLQWQPDIIHCHHWQTGSVPLFLKTLYHKAPFFREISCFFQIGRSNEEAYFTADCLEWMGLSPSDIRPEVKQDEKYSFIKAGIVYADMLGLGSNPQTDNKSKASLFTRFLKERKDDVAVLPMGIDDKEWNPVADDLITAKYSDEDPENKKQNTKALLEKLNLEYSPKRPVVSLIEPMVNREGLKQVWNALEELMRLDIQFLYFGLKEEREGFPFKTAAQKYGTKMHIIDSREESMLHWLQAGTDIQLIPSISDSACLSPLIALQYGIIPVYHADVLHFESFAPYSSKTGEGIGFRFALTNGKDMVQSLRQAVSAFSNPRDRWQLVKNCMSRDFSWSSVTRKYINCYQKCLSAMMNNR
ncbi:MAG TPA: glycogen synthase [bacterium]|nr:glycogen synthase [bacterium]